jgi:hypothetical protein
MTYLLPMPKQLGEALESLTELLTLDEEFRLLRTLFTPART